jgi:hypothetical protein
LAFHDALGARERLERAGGQAFVLAGPGDLWDVCALEPAVA